MSYISDHPTHFRWRSDISEIVRQLRARWDRGTWVGTYEWHPPYDPPVITRRYDAVSFDVWGPEGRNDPIGFELGQRVFDFVYHDPNPPWIEWCIWRRTLRKRSNGFVPEPFETDPFSHHDDHPHFSFVPPFRRLS